MNKCFPTIILAGLMLTFTQPLFTFAWEKWIPSRDGIRYATCAGIGLGAVWIMSRFSKQDRFLHRVEARIPQEGVRRLIGRWALKLNAAAAQEEREQLLSAVIPFESQQVDAAIATVRTHAATNMALYNNNPGYAHVREASAKQESPIALYGCLMSPHHPLEQRDLLEEQRLPGATILFKTMDKTQTIFDTPLMHGDAAFVVYSDGSLKIFLSDVDERALAELSDVQRLFIQNLHRPHGRFSLLNSIESSLFSSLSTNMKRSLDIYHRTTFVTIPVACKTALYGALMTTLFCFGTYKLTNFGINKIDALGRYCARFFRK